MNELSQDIINNILKYINPQEFKNIMLCSKKLYIQVKTSIKYLINIKNIRLFIYNNKITSIMFAKYHNRNIYLYPYKPEEKPCMDPFSVQMTIIAVIAIITLIITSILAILSKKN